MKSIVDYFTPVDEITIPNNYFEINIPSWRAVLEPTLAVIAKEFFPNDPLNQSITDDMIRSLNIPSVSTLDELLETTKHNYVVRLADRLFYERILPFILTYWQISSEVVINQEEWLEYQQQRRDYLATYAKDYNMSVEDYCRNVLNIQGDLNEALKEQAKEEFVFKLIAHKVYESQGYGYTLEDYEAYIQKQSLENHEDPIELKENLPFPVFQTQIAEIYLTQLLHDYFVPQFVFHIKDEGVDTPIDEIVMEGL